MNNLHSFTSKLLVAFFALLAVSALIAPAQALAFTGIEGDSTYLSEKIGDDIYIAGNSITISGVIEGDVFAAGQAITISGIVKGDVFAAAQTITISGEVSGDVMAASQTVRISGTVGESVRSAGQDILIEGKVGHDVLAAAASVTIAATGSVGRDALVGAGTFNVRGPVGRDIQSDTEEFVLSSSAGRDVSVISPKINIAQGAAIAGGLTYYSDNTATIAGTVSGETVHKPAPITSSSGTKKQLEPSTAQKVSITLLGWIRSVIATMLVALIAVFAFRGFTETATLRLTNNVWKSLGVGTLTLFLIFPIVMTIFVVGILIGGWGITFAIIGFYQVVARIGIVVASYALGRLLFQQLGIKIIHPLLPILTAVALIEAIGLIPFFGWLLGAAVYLFGSGAVLLEIVARAKEENASYKYVAEPTEPLLPQS